MHLINRRSMIYHTLLIVDEGAAVDFINREMEDGNITRNVEETISSAMRSPHDPDRGVNDVSQGSECIRASDNVSLDELNQEMPLPVDLSAMDTPSQHNSELQVTSTNEDADVTENANELSNNIFSPSISLPNASQACIQFFNSNSVGEIHNGNGGDNRRVQSGLPTTNNE